MLALTLLIRECHVGLRSAHNLRSAKISISNKHKIYKKMDIGPNTHNLETLIL